MLTLELAAHVARRASMRPRGQTPRMRPGAARQQHRGAARFNEAAGADPADAREERLERDSNDPLQ